MVMTADANPHLLRAREALGLLLQHLPQRLQFFGNQLPLLGGLVRGRGAAREFEPQPRRFPGGQAEKIGDRRERFEWVRRTDEESSLARLKECREAAGGVGLRTVNKRDLGLDPRAV